MESEHGRQRVDPPIPWAEFEAGARRYRRVDLWALAAAAGVALERLPFALRVLLENVARNVGPGWSTREDVDRLLACAPGRDRPRAGGPALALRASRVILPDSSGLPALMDLAALRTALSGSGRDPGAVQPLVPVDLVVDHSLMVDHYGRADAIVLNMAREFERNAERYRFFKWAQNAFDGLRIVPPGMGIIHQVHLEHIARVVVVSETATRAGVRQAGATAAEPVRSAAVHAMRPAAADPGQLPVAHPEFVLGGDSHTPMINGLGVLGWGVGGVDAEAAMLEQPYVLGWPRFVGVRLSGQLPTGATTTDLVLTVTQRLRGSGVVGAIVEFTGPGCALLSVPDRATIANMAPEYGATAGFFPIDHQTIAYLRHTGRAAEQVALVEAYARSAGLYRGRTAPEPRFDDCIEIDLGAVEPSMSGPLRPQDRQPLRAVRDGFARALSRPAAEGGYGQPEADTAAEHMLALGDRRWSVRHGLVAIAAITACTNTSNPGVMLAAGLLARNAVRAGLTVPGYVKTSLAPGSRVVTRYLDQAGLLEPLQALGFHLIGYGCTTCSGKSGPLPEPVARLIDETGLIAAAVVSSNRNFEGRVHRQLRAAYLASPPLVVAYAIAGRVDIDPEREPLGHGPNGDPVFLRDLWPDPAEVEQLLEATREPRLYTENYADAYRGTLEWHALEAPTGPLYPWDSSSTYLLEPPFFGGGDGTLPGGAGLPDAIDGARALAVFGDALSTDHISPAGEIPRDSAAGRFLSRLGVPARDFNAFTMRRGNHEVMIRGTFAHPRTRNLLVPDAPGGSTLLLPEQKACPVHEAARAYAASGVPVIVLGGRDYGMGSSRDWAAKGPRLLGVRAVVAESFERIHRANLIALGIVPLRFAPGQSRASLGLTGTELFTLRGLHEGVTEGGPITIEAVRDTGEAGAPGTGAEAAVRFEVFADIAAPAEAQMLRAGGMYARVLRSFAERPASRDGIARSR